MFDTRLKNSLSSFLKYAFTNGKRFIHGLGSLSLYIGDNEFTMSCDGVLDNIKIVEDNLQASTISANVMVLQVPALNLKDISALRDGKLFHNSSQMTNIRFAIIKYVKSVITTKTNRAISELKGNFCR